MVRVVVPFGLVTSVPSECMVRFHRNANYTP
jgi:hypothetical protein